MEIAEKILASAMDKYWQAKGEGSDWHFCHKTEDVRSTSKVVDRLMKTKQKFPFMVESLNKTYVLFFF